MDTQTIRDNISKALMIEMSLPKVKSEWTYEQRLAYNKEFAKRILDAGSVAGFTGTELAAAHHVYTAPQYPLEDTSFDWKMFGNEILNQAEELNPLSTRNRTQTAWMIFGAVVLIGIAYVYFNKKAPVSA